MKAPTLTLFCRCAKGEAQLAEPRRGILSALRSAGQPMLVVDDLCGAVARRDEQLRAVIEGQSVLVVACQPRAVKWLFQKLGGKPESVEALNGRAEMPESVLARLQSAAPAGAAVEPNSLESTDAWIPWFPVIDYEECVNCKECLSFCLFGVYALNDDGEVTVVHPENCKNNCPACARVCPKAAIIFPKFPDAPINGGPATEKIAEAPMQVDLKKALGSNIYDALAKRRQHRSILAKRPDFLTPPPKDGQ